MACTALYPKNPSDLHSQTAEDDFEALQEWMVSREALGRPLHEVEQEQLKRTLEMNRKLLQQHIDQRGPGDFGPKLTVLRGPEALTLDRGRIRCHQIRSIFGGVVAQRMVYSSLGLSSVHPLDEQLALFHRSYSYEVWRWTVSAAVQGPFHEAVTMVRERTGLKDLKA